MRQRRRLYRVFIMPCLWMHLTPIAVDVFVAIASERVNAACVRLILINIKIWKIIFLHGNCKESAQLKFNDSHSNIIKCRWSIFARFSSSSCTHHRTSYQSFCRTYHHSNLTAVCPLWMQMINMGEGCLNFGLSRRVFCKQTICNTKNYRNESVRLSTDD